MRPGIGELKVFPSIWGHWAGGEFLLHPFSEAPRFDR